MANSKIPITWAEVALGEVCSVVQGQSPPSKTYNTERKGLPFLQGKAEFGTMYPEAIKWCSVPKKIAEPGDVLISVRAPVGPTNLCAVRSCIGRGLAAIRTRANMPPKFFLYALRAQEEKLRSKSTGTTFQAIRGDDLRSHQIGLPPIPEQRRIVAEIEKQFTRLDAAEDALRRVAANLKRYRASVLKAACEGKLVATEAELAEVEGRDYEHAEQLLERILAERRARWESEEKRRGKYKEPVSPDTSDSPELPDGWVWASVIQLATVASGQTPKGIVDVARTSSTGIPWFRVGDMNAPGNEVEMIVASSVIPEPDVVRLGLHLRPPGTIIFPKRGGGNCNEQEAPFV